MLDWDPEPSYTRVLLQMVAIVDYAFAFEQCHAKLGLSPWQELRPNSSSLLRLFG